MATLADLFKTYYLTGGRGVEFSAVRLHHRGVDEICRAFGATALTVGSDIYFRQEAFAPHTREGLRLLAHEVAHVVQQHRGPVAAAQAGGGLAVAPAGSAQEREADAAADALVSGRPFYFGAAGDFGVAGDFGAARSASAASGPGRRLVVQRYMAWEHCVLGDLDPARLGAEHLDAQCALLEQLGREPRHVDEERLRAGHPGAQTLRLPGSGLVVTLGELNVLPDDLAHPAEIENAPEAFLLPLIQSVRSLNIAELRRLAGSGFRHGPRRRLPGSLKYPRLRQLAEIGEVLEVDALGRRCGFAPWKLYSSAVGRNAGHFAPFSWYRWRSYHLMARDLIARSLAAGQDREKLRTRARIYRDTPIISSRTLTRRGSACPHRTSRPCGTGNRTGSLSLFSTMDFTVKPVTSAQWPALEDLFGRSGASNGCWCMYWRIGPRYRDRPRADNKEDLRQLAASGRPPGLLAFDENRAVGWCELAPRAELGWLARARYLEPVDDLPVWSVPCFYVRSSHRGLGVMDALIEAALPTAVSAGAPALEAYPVDTAVPSHTGNLFPGIAAAFARHGFEVVARRKPDRPVMRKLLGTSGPSIATCTRSILPGPG